MDRQANVQELFSRGASPPPSDPQFQQRQAYSNQPPRISPPNALDTLFRGLGTNTQQHNGGLSGTLSTISTLSNPQSVQSDPITPLSLLEEGPHSQGPSQNPSGDRERQNALLTLLGSVASPNGGQNRNVLPPSQPPVPQIPTPPATSHNEPQGKPQEKLLLDQLMTGNPPRSNYSDSQRSLQTSGPSPPYVKPSPPVEETYHNREPIYPVQDTPRDATAPRPQLQEQAQSQPQQQQPPSPRKSIFDFVSPFDALAASGSNKKKPVPQPGSSSSGNEDSWTNASISDQKENVMDTFNRAPVSHPNLQAQPVGYDVYTSTDELSQTESGPLGGLTGLLSSKATDMPDPHKASPPKAQGPRHQHRATESPVGAGQSPNLPPPNRRENRDSGSLSRGSWKGGKPTGQKPKSHTSPTQQPQNIVFDVSQPLDEIQAPQDTVKSTAIALVKQDSVFLPGTTIGATHWVAYAMTRGRVRVISRSSGDRTLLQLPSAFTNSSSVTDMAVYGNRLAGVTSDGGFVVWELPEVITDDVPGNLLLCFPPTSDPDAFHSVKWHPNQQDTLAVASQTTVYVIDLVNASRFARGQPLLHSDLSRFSQLFTVSSRVVAFDFDAQHFAIAAISEDSTLTSWNIRDRMPIWHQRVRGDELPSSLTFVDGGIVVGRKNGTILQLLSFTARNVLATVKFVNETEDPGMFGHVNYDSRIQTLWVANSRRDSMIALKFGFDPSLGINDENRVYLEQVVEFPGPKPTIHFVILTAHADPNGDEAHAACVAAKVPPGELALVAFSVHSSGVDQILIRKEWYDSALVTTTAKFPPYSLTSVSHDTRGARQGPALQSSPAFATAPAANQGRPRTPPSDDVEGDFTRDDARSDAGRKSRPKNVGWKDKDEGVRKDAKPGDSSVGGDPPLNQMTKDIRKMEDNLHTRIGRLIGKEMEKQHLRLEDARAKDQAEDFARQEKILKLISTELTKNTTRVVEVAVKNEVQNSVLPALENITQREVKSALNEQIGRGLADYIQQSLPLEIEKLLKRSDISNHFSHVLSSNLTPLVERNIKEALNKTFLPVFAQQHTSMHQEVAREFRSEIVSVKKELFSVQTDAFRSQEALIRELEHTVRALSDQVKYLSINAPPPVLPMHHHVGTRSSPSSNVQLPQQNINHPLRQPPVPQGSNYSQSYQQQQSAQPMPGPWFPTTIAAPQASHPAAPPPATAPNRSQRSPPLIQEEWDDTYLAVLGTQDPRQLRDLLARSNSEVVMPLNGPGPLSQAVILTLLHRLAAAVAETPPADDTFKSTLRWLQRTASTLNTNDPLISPYIARVVPNVQQMLNTTKQRLSIIPGGPQLLDAARTISDVQDTLSRKPM